jgi:hypothetical protein
VKSPEDQKTQTELTVNSPEARAKAMKKRGRPTRLDSELTRKICGLLSEGISITAACDALGIAESTYHRWMGDNAKFREQATRARANGKIALVRQILADKDWRGKSWYLERC